MPRTAKRKSAPIIPRDNVVNFPLPKKPTVTIRVPRPMIDDEVCVKTLSLSDPQAYRVFGLFDDDLILINQTIGPGDGDLCYVENSDGEHIIRYYSEIRDSDTYKGVVYGFQRHFRRF